MNKTVCVFSGGQDSTTCLFWALSHKHEVYPVTFNYGQRHAIEIESSKKVLEIAKCYYPNLVKDQEVITIGPVLKGTSPLVSGETLEQYKDCNSLPGGLEKTFVPMRNQMFLTIAANRAALVGATKLLTGVCQADSGGYPDCRQDFIDALEEACNYGTFTGEKGAPENLQILTPLMNMSKAESVRLAYALPYCYGALAFSHTSYDGAWPPTGHDHATLLRERGFLEAGLPDPLIVRCWRDNWMKLPNTPNYTQDLVKMCLEQVEEAEQLID